MPLTLPLTDPVHLFTVILLSITIAPFIGRLTKLPALIILIVLGIFLGTHGFGILDRNPPVQLLEKIGLLYIMLLAGLQMNLKDLRQVGIRAAIFGLLTFGIPLVLGIILATTLQYPWLTGLLIGIMFSPHTLIAYPILLRLNIAQEESVSVAIGGTVITSILTLSGLAIVQSIAGGNLSSMLWIKLGLGLPILAAIVIWAVHKILGDIFSSELDNLGEPFIWVLAILFGVASLTLLLGVDSIVGAFIAGLALNPIIAKQKPLLTQIEFIGVNLFIPCFLIAVGLLCNPKMLIEHPENLGLAAYIIVVAIAGKFLAAWLSGTWFRYSFPEIMTSTGLTLSRAALVLVIALYGKGTVLAGTQTPLLSEGLFNAIVVYISVTCLVGPLVTNHFGRQIQGNPTTIA